MNKEYKLVFTKKAAKKYEKLISNNKALQEKLRKIFITLITDPFQQNLNTHKVNITDYGLVYSSKVTGDIRIIWELENDKITITLLDIGGHSGSTGVYK